MNDLYVQIYRRKSFHRFKNTIPINQEDLILINNIINKVVPLDKSIKFMTKLVKENVTAQKLGAEYCILFYSEKKDFYLENIGYIGEQIDLELTKNNIGTLWCGLGKTNEKSLKGLDFVIMILISKVNENEFRKDLTSFKRKSIDKVWQGKQLNLSKTVILSPSAVNSQPWYTINYDNELLIYRNLAAAKFGIIPLKIMHFYNQIDMGIYLYILELCLMNEKYDFTKELISNEDYDGSKILLARYKYYQNREK